MKKHYNFNKLDNFYWIFSFRPLTETEVSIINCPPPYTEEHFPPQYSINYSSNNNNNNSSVGINNNSSSNSYNYNFHNNSSDNNLLSRNNNNNNIYQSLPTQLFGRSSTLYLSEESSSTQLFILNRDEDADEDN